MGQRILGKFRACTGAYAVKGVAGSGHHRRVMTTLTDLLPTTADPDTVFEAFSGWAAGQGLTLYPHQEDALIEVVSGSNAIVSTPTGSGKSLIATGAHFAALPF